MELKELIFNLISSPKVWQNSSSGPCPKRVTKVRRKGDRILPYFYIFRDIIERPVNLFPTLRPVRGAARARGAAGASGTAGLVAGLEWEGNRLKIEDSRNPNVLQGGPSGRGQPFVDIAIRVAFYFKKFTMRLNFDKQYSTTRWTTLYIFKSLQAAFLIVCLCKNIP